MKEDKLIYLDNAATTSPNPDVVALYNEVAKKHFGNASSIHALGVDANKYLNASREKILKAYGLSGYQVLFTSGATESNNLAIKGLAFQYKNRGKHLITTKIEHPSVLEAFKQLENDFDYRVTYLNVDKCGVVNLDELKDALDDETILVSIMAVNNEVGTIEPIEEISKLVHKYPKAILHVDATQAIGKILIDYKNVDVFSYSAHKIRGLKGSGALIYKNKLSFKPLLSGGDQEFGIRAGTNDVASACAIAKATELALKNQSVSTEHVAMLHKELTKEIVDENIIFNSNEFSSPFIINFSLLDKKASVVVEALSRSGIFVSSVSACHSKREPQSYVVEAMSGDVNRAKNTIRVSLDKDNNKEDIETFANEFKKIVRSLR